MTSLQVSLFQLDNYGPWTTTPAPRPEPELQALQARLYADLAEAIGAHDGYTFFGRFDNMVAITNGIDRDTHRQIQQCLGKQYPVTVSAGIGTGETPAAALADATALLQQAGSAQDPAREAILAGDPTTDGGSLQVAHFDIVDVTRTLTDRVDAHGAMLEIQAATRTLSQYLYETHDGLGYYVGGDNLIAICPLLSQREYQAVIDHVRAQHDIPFQVGVGTGMTAAEAGMSAKQALERCRDNGTQIEGLSQTVTSD